jgi:adenylate kinase
MGMTDLRLLILGPPGAGKGTQSSNIAEEFGLEHITTGDALRANKQMDISDMDTEYDTPAEYMDAGDLVPDKVVNAIVEEALSQADGFVLDGYPRNLDQAEELESMTDLDVILKLDVSRDVLVKRLTGRRVDPETGENYHVEFDMPEDPAVRDRLVQRDDDNEDSVRNRLAVFDDKTAPVIANYDAHDGFVSIDGEQSPDEVWADIRDAVQDHV